MSISRNRSGETFADWRLGETVVLAEALATRDECARRRVSAGGTDGISCYWDGPRACGSRERPLG